MTPSKVLCIPVKQERLSCITGRMTEVQQVVLSDRHDSLKHKRLNRSVEIYVGAKNQVRVRLYETAT